MVSWLIAVVIMALNIKLVIDTLSELLTGKNTNLLIVVIALSVIVSLGILLVYIVFEPILSKIIRSKSQKRKEANIHGSGIMPVVKEIKPFKKIAVALDFTDSDGEILSYAVGIAKDSSELVLMHVIESAGANVNGNEIEDIESKKDRERLNRYADELRKMGVKDVYVEIGYGEM